MSLVRFRGGIALVGPHVDELAKAEISKLKNTRYAEHTSRFRDPNSEVYHITLITKDEMRHHGIQEAPPPLGSVDVPHLHAAGVGGSTKIGVFFVVIVWAAGQTLRKRAGLEPKHFHITLSTVDDHTIDKSYDALLPGVLPSPPSDPSFLDHLAFTFHIHGRFDRARSVGTELCKVDPTSERGFLRHADAAFKMEMHKLAMLSYACAFRRCSDSKVSDYCLKKIEDCTEHTEWGLVFTQTDREQLTGEVPPELLEQWSATLCEELNNRIPQTLPSRCALAREPLFVPLEIKSVGQPDYYRLPRWFRWLVPFHVALMSTPRNETDVSILESRLGINHILTLTEETPLDPLWFSKRNIRNTFLPIPNYRPPTLEQMDLIVRLLADERNTPMLIHCGGGKGRAGTVAACYLAAFGFAKPDLHRTEPAMSASDAIAALRAMRPGSLETAQQEAFVSKYCSAIWKRQAVLSDLVSEPAPCALEVEGTLPRSPDLLVLVGLPGSGKSTFARTVAARSRGWTYVSQDESGSRAACDAAVGNVRGGGRVLLDACNVARDGRKTWLGLAGHWAKAPVCVWFDYDKELCVSRAQNRAGHATLPPGNRVRNAMDQMQRMFVRPALAEGFEAVVIVRSFAAGEELVVRLSPPVVLLKFPRTPHLLDLGSVTSDDIVGGVPDVRNGHVVVTEKVDGANMGFSLSADRTQILVQNRSHYVNPRSQEQFRKLDVWVERHRAGLMKVLDRDPLFAQRYILYGEWLVATHSIGYSRLPDWFLAFDLYDRSLDQWADRRTMETLLADTDIHLVPVVHEGKMLDERELRMAVQEPSRFYDGRVEGVYVKIEKRGVVVARGKVVRSDFISGNEHWSKGPLQLNNLEELHSMKLERGVIE